MTLQTFTGSQYLKIDIANNFGLDKWGWAERILWFNENENNLHSLVQKAEEPALFYAGIVAWEKFWSGQPNGYPISLDATCSGIQILAALACDRKAAELCNVVDTGQREDAYTGIYDRMVSTLGTQARIDRKLTKKAIMTSFYGSTAQPKAIFGDGKQLETFYEVIKANAPGAWEITEAMLQIWDPTALIYEWVLPDNFHVKVKVQGKVHEWVQFLNEPYEVIHEENMTQKEGRSLGANMVHSLDGMIVREMLRRCHYDPVRISKLSTLAAVGCCGRSRNKDQDVLVRQLWKHYENTGFLSARILSYLDIDNMGHVNPIIIGNLIESLPKKPFKSRK